MSGITGIAPLDEALDEFCDDDGELWLALTAIAIPIAISLGMDPLQSRNVTAADSPHLRDAWAALATFVLLDATSAPQVLRAAKLARFATHAANEALTITTSKEHTS